MIKDPEICRNFLKSIFLQFAEILDSFSLELNQIISILGCCLSAGPVDLINYKSKDLIISKSFQFVAFDFCYEDRKLDNFDHSFG